ncbi:hypothetical protein ACMDCR_26510 [Labrys okinawensis]|uniref:hypothetical protein n=1 Tax=Labrys okinawensis TaxID=346911 RepID=UPI0039BD84F2
MSLTAVGVLTLSLAAGFTIPAVAQQQPTAKTPPSAPAQQQPAATTPPPTAAPAGPQAVKLDPKAILVLVRSTLIALDQANKTGNYSVLRDLGAPDFQRGNTLAKLGDLFAGQRKVGLDLSAALILEPTITLQPQVESNGLLHLAGYFPVNGDGKLNFEMLYQFVDKRLVLYGLSVNVSQAGSPPAAAQAPAPVPATGAPAAPAPAANAPGPAAAPAPASSDPPKAKPKPKPKPKPKAEPKPAPDAAPAQ